jgi:hypothetical protein
MLYIFRMLQHNKENMSTDNRNPIRKIHFVGTSAVLTIDHSHVKRLDIDDLTFFEEKPTENGILLEVRRFSS